MRINKIIIRGEEQPAALMPEASDDYLELKRSFAVGAAVRGTTDAHAVDISEDDVVEVVYGDEVSWICNSDTLSELFPEIDLQKRSIGDEFVLPDSLSASGADRGLGDVFVKFFRLFKKKPAIVGKKVRELASNLEKKNLGNNIGLFRLDQNFQFQPIIPDQTNKPYLLFLHGTNSSTEKSFGDIQGTEVWTFLTQTFKTNILAFQHESLTKSPLENVLDLVNKLPQHCDLHLVSQSRGGLIGDILCRFCGSNENKSGFTANEIKILKEAKRTDDLAKIEAITKALQSRRVSVKKYVRVACPGGGTTLASKRLDDFFNITFNLIGIATGIMSNPLFAASKNLLVSVINTKNDVDILPGVEAMSKQSPFIKILNLPGSEIAVDVPLLVIAGNAKARFNLKGLLIIASKLFFTQQNDLIVDTQSMTLGAKRSLPVQRFFDEGGDVDHFHYFKNKVTNDALLRALQSTDDTQPIAGFAESTGTRMLTTADRNILINAGLLEGGELFSNKVTGSKPILLMLPGIMGSNLSENDNVLWIDYLKLITGGLKKLSSDNIKATSLVKTSYKKLKEYLSEEYDVVTFPFDWRKHLNDSAKLLDKTIGELLAFRQPIKIIGHSMGGVLVRDFIINHPATWKQLNESQGFRLLFLGAPLGGSFRIPAVLFGQDSIINKLSKIDVFHSKKSLLEMFSKMDGLLSLLPLTTDGEYDFANPQVWETMRKTIEKDWPIPDKAQLTNRFLNYRKNVLEASDKIDYTNMVYIAGRDKATACGYRFEKRADNTEEIVFLSTGEGDQSVTWESGIPRKMVENDSVYYVNVTHGALPNEPSLFKGITEILSMGSTRLFSKTRPVVRGQDKLFRSPQPDDFDLSREGVENTLLGLTGESTEKAFEEPLRVSIAKGDLLYSSYPLLVGHFNGDGIVSAEKAINWNLDGALSQRHSLGLYPGKIGTHEILIPEDDSFKGAVIVGLGDMGSLTSYQLAQTVEQGVAKYLLMLNSRQVTAREVGISSLIIGSGYGGITVEGSIRAVIQGVNNANSKIKNIYAEKSPALIQKIEFIELYDDVALNAFLALNRIEKLNDSSLSIVMDPKKMVTRLGGRKRLASSMSDEWWTRITVKVIEDITDPNYQGLRFTISTGGAREEQRTLQTTRSIIEQLVKEISTNNNWSVSLAKTLFELLIPTDFKEQLKRQSNINWVVDENTAPIPWELLQDGSIANAKPLCVNAGMVRQLATEDYRLKINAVTNMNALIVADPLLKGFAPQLPGAEQEGKDVNVILKNNGFITTPVISESSFKIIQALFSEDYKIIHLAGHGIFNEELKKSTKSDPLGTKSQKVSGMLIGDNVFLSTREIAQMSTTPEFVFVNCCFLGKSDATAEKYFQDRFHLAANIGTQLINNGVKAVIAAGWAVDDSAALEFTKTFYNKMFEGYNFGDAVREARNIVFGKYDYTNTWGAYQCYGDQYYRFNLTKSSQSSEKEFIISAEAENALYNLKSMAETGQYTSEEIFTKLAAISKQVDKAGLRTAAITEKEAFIFADLYDYDSCLSKLEKLFQTESADYSVSSFEKYCNIRAKKYVRDFMDKQDNAAAYLKKMGKVIADLKVLINTSPTAERHNLMGSAFKRQGLLSATNALKLKAYKDAALSYREAYRGKNNPDVIYPLTNWIAIESILRLMRKGVDGQKPTKSETQKNDDLFKKGLAYLKQEENNLMAMGDVNSYWDLSKTANVKLSLLIAGPAASRKKAKDDVFLAYRKLWKKAGSKGKRFAEIEHLTILSDSLSMSRSADVTGLKKIVNELKSDLQKIA